MRSMLDHWAEVSKTHTTIVEFLEWAERHGYVMIESPVKPSVMADEYLEVDQGQLDKERRMLLAQ